MQSTPTQRAAYGCKSHRHACAFNRARFQRTGLPIPDEYYRRDSLPIANKSDQELRALVVKMEAARKTADRPALLTEAHK